MHSIFLQALVGSLYFSRAVFAQNFTDPEPDNPDYEYPFQGEAFDWEALTPSRNLSNFVPCYTENTDNIFCTRLIVPLDWSGKTPGEVILAVAKIPARENVTWAGPLLTNPGGPGGSGIQQIYMVAQGQLFAGGGSSLHELTGGQYDIYSWDPRGVGFSTPAAECFNDDIERSVWNHETTPNMPYEEFTARHTFARQGALASKCNEMLKDIAPFLGTVATARDMRHISKLAWEAKGQEYGGTNFFGVSYGTFLGSTFATMFPDEVNRMLLDAVLESEGYASSDGFYNAVYDTDKILADFFKRCAKSEECEFSNYGNLSTRQVRQRFDRLAERMRDDPIRVFSEEGIQLYDEGYLKNSINSLLYGPLQAYSIMSYVLTFWESIGKTELVDQVFGLPRRVCSKNPDLLPAHPPRNEATLAIMCADVGPLNFTSFAEFKPQWKKLIARSQIGGPVWAYHLAACSGYAHTAAEHIVKHGAKTRHPILWTTTELDPVTPARSAYAMQKKYPGSAVLSVPTAGHGIISTRSKCGEEAFRDYFVNGKLPKKKSCTVDLQPLERDPLRRKRGLRYHHRIHNTYVPGAREIEADIDRILRSKSRSRK